MIVNSISEVRGVATLGRGPKAELQEILPAPLKGVPVNNVGSLVSSHTRRSSTAALVNACAALGPSSYALRSDVDNTSWRERCE